MEQQCRRAVLDFPGQRPHRKSSQDREYKIQEEIIYEIDVGNVHEEHDAFSGDGGQPRLKFGQCAGVPQA